MKKRILGTMFIAFALLASGCGGGNSGNQTVSVTGVRITPQESYLNVGDTQNLISLLNLKTQLIKTFPGQ